MAEAVAVLAGPGDDAGPPTLLEGGAAVLQLVVSSDEARRWVGGRSRRPDAT